MPSLRRVLAAGLLSGLGKGLGQTGETMNEDRRLLAKQALEKSSAQQDFEYYRDTLTDPADRHNFLAVKSAGVLQPTNSGSIIRRDPPPNYGPPSLQEELVNIESKIKAGGKLSPKQNARYEALKEQVGKGKPKPVW